MSELLQKVYRERASYLARYNQAPNALIVGHEAWAVIRRELEADGYSAVRTAQWDRRLMGMDVYVDTGADPVFLAVGHLG